LIDKDKNPSIVFGIGDGVFHQDHRFGTQNQYGFSTSNGHIWGEYQD